MVYYKKWYHRRGDYAIQYETAEFSSFYIGWEIEKLKLWLECMFVKNYCSLLQTTINLMSYPLLWMCFVYSVSVQCSNDKHYQQLTIEFDFHLGHCKIIWMNNVHIEESGSTQTQNKKTELWPLSPKWKWQNIYMYITKIIYLYFIESRLWHVLYWMLLLIVYMFCNSHGLCFDTVFCKISCHVYTSFTRSSYR